MLYHITRGGQSYGPYTLADLQRYVASGHVLPSDLAKSEAIAEWIPVSQILTPTDPLPVGSPASPSAYAAPGTDSLLGGYARPGYSPDANVNAFPDPPNLHWGLVLLFGLLTCGLFIVIWELVQAAWLRKIAPQSKAFVLYAVSDIAYLGMGYNSFVGAFRHTAGGLSALCQIIYVVLNVWARFSFKASLEEHFNQAEPIGLTMSGVMTFFFGTLYLQWHLSRINQIKQALRYRDFGR